MGVKDSKKNIQYTEPIAENAIIKRVNRTCQSLIDFFFIIYCR